MTRFKFLWFLDSSYDEQLPDRQSQTAYAFLQRNVRGSRFERRSQKDAAAISANTSFHRSAPLYRKEQSSLPVHEIWANRRILLKRINLWSKKKTDSKKKRVNSKVAIAHSSTHKTPPTSVQFYILCQTRKPHIYIYIIYIWPCWGSLGLSCILFRFAF